MNLRDQLMQTWTELVESVVAWTPRVAVGLVMFVVAIVFAKLVERILRGALTKLKFDTLVARAGLDQAMQKVGIRQSINQFVPRIVYFLLLILFARTAADALGLEAISSAIASFMGYLPNIVAAMLILILGSAASQFAGRAVEEAATNAGIDFARPLGTVVSAMLLFVLGIMAVTQLKIDTEIVRLFAAAVLGAGALAFGVSFGLGSRDITRNILAGFYAKKTFRIGERMEVAGQEGILSGITPTQTLLEQDGRMIAVANSVFLDEVVKQ
ncbi:MAG: mechanosensitive ion channel family protein [Longimicrobiales bacterium]